MSDTYHLAAPERKQSNRRHDKWVAAAVKFNLPVPRTVAICSMHNAGYFHDTIAEMLGVNPYEVSQAVRVCYPYLKKR